MAARFLLLGACAVFVSIAVPALHAQEPPPTETAVAADSAGPTPAGALVRSLLIPGWGQAALGAYVRGSVYFGLQGASWFMLFKTIKKVGEASEIEARRVELARAEVLAAADSTLRAQYEQNPALLEAAIDTIPSVAASRNLVGSRKEQREDWIAWVAFWTLASAVDAYVTAHLADFPARATVAPRPGGGFRIGVSVPARRWW